MRSGSPTPSQRIKSALAVLVSLAVLGGGGTLVAIKGYEWYQDWRQADDYLGDGDQKITVTIPDGVTLTRIGDILEANDVVRTSEAFIDAIETREEDTGEPVNLDFGWYEMKTHWPAVTALDCMLDPDNRVTRVITVAEGKRWADIRPELAADTGFREHDFEVAAAQPAVIGLPDYAGGQVEGYLFPDTYQVPPSAPGVLRKMTDQFKAVAGELDLEGRAAAWSVPPGDIVKIASIIEAEVSR
ncbi:MAG: endolytic transglycosylase MltG, partial [Propionibacteriaceae bacterium]|nr:endolytic transglycosylase MltG [Propionibacteriaceae bacterium]